jgi:hypothetical protein
MWVCLHAPPVLTLAFPALIGVPNEMPTFKSAKFADGQKILHNKRLHRPLTPPTLHTQHAQCFSSVVGPNGSGKSNVIDAMLFVFGCVISSSSSSFASSFCPNLKNEFRVFLKRSSSSSPTRFLLRGAPTHTRAHAHCEQLPSQQDPPGEAERAHPQLGEPPRRGLLLGVCLLQADCGQRW